MYQSTINKTIELSGAGLFSGKKVNMIMSPADIDSGIVFLVDGEKIEAKYSNVKQTNRRTIISNGNIEIHTVEHLMASLYFCGISNIIIEMDSYEPPIMDGSSKEFVDCIKRAGIKKQNKQIRPVIIDRKVTYELPSKDSYVTALPYDGFKITYIIDYPSCNSISKDQFSIDISFGDNQYKELASARTFCLASELLDLNKVDALKGATLNNGIVYIDNDISQDIKNQLTDIYKLNKNAFDNKILNNTNLRFNNEAIRHKILDLIGDLYLLGRPLKGHIIAHKSGHSENIELTKKIAKELKVNHDLKKYRFDINDILKILHHRYPFLLIDEILELIPDKSVRAIKNVTFNEPYFQGHFPGKAIMPGVLIVEAMAQSGGFLLLHTVEDPLKQLVIFSRINYAKFKKKIVPGDSVIFETDLISFKMNTCKLKSRAIVNDEIVAEAEFMTTITEKDF